MDRCSSICVFNTSSDTRCTKTPPTMRRAERSSITYGHGETIIHSKKLHTSTTKRSQETTHSCVQAIDSQARRITPTSCSTMTPEALRTCPNTPSTYASGEYSEKRRLSMVWQVMVFHDAKGSKHMRDRLVGAPCKFHDGLDGCDGWEEEVDHRERDNHRSLLCGTNNVHATER